MEGPERIQSRRAIALRQMLCFLAALILKRMLLQETIEFFTATTERINGMIPRSFSTLGINVFL